MKLKKTIENKIKKMNNNDLIILINELCDINEDNIKYLNNSLSNASINVDKEINKIDKCFYSVNINLNKALNIYWELNRTYKDYKGICDVGLHLLENIDMFYDCYLDSIFEIIFELSESICSNILKINDNSIYINRIKDILDKFEYEELFELYSYFDDL